MLTATQKDDTTDDKYFRFIVAYLREAKQVELTEAESLEQDIDTGEASELFEEKQDETSD